MAYPTEPEFNLEGFPKYGPPTMIPGPKILNLGVPGVGKSWALKTILKAKFIPHIIFAEQPTPSLVSNPDIKWTHIKPRDQRFSDMIAYAEKINTTTVDFLAKMEDPNKRESSQFIDLLRALNNFTDNPSGEQFGPVDEWGPRRVLVIDALTGINKMVLDLVTGNRAIRSFPEWNVAQDQAARLIDKLTNLYCSVIILAHLEPERDEVTGRVTNAPATIGRKLAPILGRNFDEVILSERTDGRKFTWNNMTADVAVKSRYLPPSINLPQDYSAIFRLYMEAGGIPYEAVSENFETLNAQLAQTNSPSE